ncbi:MAG: hypothetical protein QG626_554 [Patescibacteria group bacterium]|nr:hypothetical protein [Patescibacteria group bacterium]
MLRRDAPNDLRLIRERQVFWQLVERKDLDLAALTGDLKRRRLGLRPETSIEMQAAEGARVVVLRDVLDRDVRDVHEQLLAELVEGGLKAGLGLDETARQRPLSVCRFMFQAAPTHAHAQSPVREPNKQHVDAHRVRRDENEVRPLEHGVRTAERVRLACPLFLCDRMTAVLVGAVVRDTSVGDDRKT